ncbi:MAG: transporter, substrate-binding protein [Bacteroidota bacterium]|nr:transporter, substrate-binding protein [Bacteroidota bacterium]
MLLQSTDQLGNSIEFNFPPKRIVSLVPSQTELLFDLGLNDEVIGLTRFCIHPTEYVKDKAKIGGTKKFDIEKIKSLQPDLIIGNKEENYKEGIIELQKHFPVWMSDIFTLADSYNMMKEVARITDREKAGEKLVDEIKNSFADYVHPAPAPNCAYFIWRKPYMVAANNTFINHMLGVFGVKNVFENANRYPEINPVTLADLTPRFIFLSSEPYSFSEKHFDEFRAFCPTAKVVLVDGEMFSWYGSRLKLSAAYFKELRIQIER